ncbi:MAG: fibronectin type III domain-containing protein [Gemmataceae bacterium]|nr:fibronectin type III domain-containing protein [Gemmataceae bacterium]
MRSLASRAVLTFLLLTGLVVAAETGPLEQKPNTWLKRSPVKDGPLSPGMGYETSMGYDPIAKRVLRWGGHNQGGGGEQNAEMWVFDPVSTKWVLKEPNRFPPGVCCANQNLFDLEQNRFLRFPSFSGSHGWHWFRENYLNNSSLWNYDLAKNTWRDMRPMPAPHPAPLRCAAWDTDCQVAVVFGGEGAGYGTVVYDPYTNSWTEMKPPGGPASRSAGNMAYDQARKLHVVFGTQFGDDPHTWAYDLRKNEWRDLKPEKMPPTDRNDAVLAYDSANQVIVASVRAIDKMDGKEVVDGHYETWAYDAGKNTWTPMKPDREPDGWGNRRRVIIYLPDQNLFLMENYINPSQRVKGVDREQQMWTYRYAEPKADSRPPAPTGVQVTTTATGATVSWQPSASPKVTGYAVLRGEGAKPWLVDYRPVAKLDKGQTNFTDKDLKPGTAYYYCVRAQADAEASEDSLKVRTQPRVIEDAVVSVLSPTNVQLSWTAPPNKDMAGYHVERAVVEVFTEDQILRLKKDTVPLAEPSVGAVKAVGKFQRITKEPVKETKFTDPSIDLTKPQAVEGESIYKHRFGAMQLDEKGKGYRFAVYAYRIRAVNALGVESGASPYFLTIPSAPEWVFSKEEGETCQLKWAANPEQKLKGYRVYRMESPRVNGPGQPVTRVTDEPLTEMKYSDPKAGSVARRYWIVAVDALGQEGFPSAPTWHNREYRKFYVPFVGEWHQ